MIVKRRDARLAKCARATGALGVTVKPRKISDITQFLQTDVMALALCCPGFLLWECLLPTKCCPGMLTLHLRLNRILEPHTSRRITGEITEALSGVSCRAAVVSFLDGTRGSQKTSPGHPFQRRILAMRFRQAIQLPDMEVVDDTDLVHPLAELCK
ncbi:hypothetical protein [uncultured Roseobacter sp.]|uniref:hypothetical protein n=1 Tax=uncultured Roseobacter sp. TaxID=114847 RepID=UPI00262425A3|nr:hypothetical protein [uncultured Roseobacter sp.]